MLGKSKIENYHPEFVYKLVEYSNKMNYEEMINTRKEDVVAFAERWPSKLMDLSYRFLEKQHARPSSLED